MRPSDQNEIPPPQKVLIVSPSAQAIDQILDKFTAIGSKVKVVRIGQSNIRTDLNKKYALEAVKPNQRNDLELHARIQK